MKGKRAAAWEMRRNPTLAEHRLWQALRRSRIGRHFRRQDIVGGFIADFTCRSAHLVIEADGPVHEGFTDCDEERDATLHAMGWRTLRFANERVMDDLEGVLVEISKALEEP
jgi:very-short-patch-repair endonuclease